MKRTAYIRLIVASALWGGGFIATTVALKDFPVMALLATRFLLAAAILLLFNFRKVKEVSLCDWLRATPIGVLLFIAFFFQTLGNGLTTVTNNSFLVALNVVFTPFLSALLLRVRPFKKDYLACFLAILGVGLLTLSGVSIDVNMGDIYSIISAVFYSGHVIYSIRLRKMNTVVITFIQMCVAGIIALITSLFIDDQSYIFSVSKESIIALVYLIIFSTLVCYLIQLSASKILTPNEVSVVLSTEALFAATFGILLLGENFSINLLISMLMLISALVVSSVEPQKDIVDQ